MVLAIPCLPANTRCSLGQRHQAGIARDLTLTLSMASSSRLVWLLASAAMHTAFLLAPASAEDFLVGGTTGWNLSYPIGWPEGKTFKVGDNLVFDYPKGQYTVTEVDSEAFRDCYRQGNTFNEWASGHDVVPLEKAGRRWFFSSLANHCDLGLKLVVNVVGAVAKAPAPAPAPATSPTPQPPHHHHPTPTPAPSPVTVPPANPPAPTTPEEAPPSQDASSAALNHYKVGEAVAGRAAVVVAGAIVAAVFL